MNKSTAILVSISIMLGASTSYLRQQHRDALRRIGQLQQEHATQVRLGEKYQAEIRDLEHYILNQYRRAPMIAGGGPPPPRAGADRTLSEPVERKYRYLLSDVGAADAERLRQLLLERESAASNDYAGRPDYETRLAEIDARIGEFLDAADYQKYSALKKSDVEQHHLNIFARGINAIAPLSPEQSQALLFARLRHKKIFEAVLGDSGIQQEKLSPTEREYAQKTITQALRQYQHDYLEEAKSLLDEEQFALLSNYEATEFKLELERLQAQIEAKM